MARSTLALLVLALPASALAADDPVAAPKYAAFGVAQNAVPSPTESWLLIGARGTFWHVQNEGVLRSEASAGIAFGSRLRFDSRAGALDLQNSASMSQGTAHVDGAYEGHLLAGWRSSQLPAIGGRLMLLGGIAGNLLSNDAVKFASVGPALELAYRYAGDSIRFVGGPMAALVIGGCWRVGPAECEDLADTAMAGGFAEVAVRRVYARAEWHHYFVSDAGGGHNLNVIDGLACGWLAASLGPLPFQACVGATEFLGWAGSASASRVGVSGLSVFLGLGSFLVAGTN